MQTSPERWARSPPASVAPGADGGTTFALICVQVEVQYLEDKDEHEGQFVSFTFSSSYQVSHWATPRDPASRARGS